MSYLSLLRLLSFYLLDSALIQSPSVWCGKYSHRGCTSAEDASPRQIARAFGQGGVSNTPKQKRQLENGRAQRAEWFFRDPEPGLPGSWPEASGGEREHFADSPDPRSERAGAAPPFRADGHTAALGRPAAGPLDCLRDPCFLLGFFESQCIYFISHAPPAGGPKKPPILSTAERLLRRGYRFKLSAFLEDFKIV